jgi:SAM-dependent methyltransferase
MKRAFEFDARYYERFYRDARTRVSDRAEAQRLVGFVAGYLRYLEQPVRNILDLGCGLGQLRAPFLKAFPSASYLGVELSDYACQRYGFTKGSVVDFKHRSRFDVVLCRGVLQYLPTREAERALDNLASLCRGCMYLEALTREDWEQNADRKLTDGAVYLRPARFYRKRLAAQFQAAGGGIFVHERSAAVLYALESL